MGSPVLGHLSLDRCPGSPHLSWVACPGSPVMGHLSWITCPVSSVLGLLSWATCPGSPVLSQPSWVTCPGSPVLAIRPGSPVLGDLSWAPCPGNPVLSHLSWQPCLGSPVLGTGHLSLVTCPVLPVLGHLSCVTRRHMFRCCAFGSSWRVAHEICQSVSRCTIMEAVSAKPPDIHIKAINTGLTAHHLSCDNSYAYAFTYALLKDLQEVFSGSNAAQGLFIFELGSQTKGESIDLAFAARSRNVLNGSHETPQAHGPSAFLDTVGSLHHYL